MAQIEWCWGWEVIANRSQSLQTWTQTGVVTANWTSFFYQHPQGFGGGTCALRCIDDGTLETPDSTQLTANNVQIQTAFYVENAFVADKLLLSMPDSGGDYIFEIKSVDAGDKSRLKVLHDGVTVFTTSTAFTKDQWHVVVLEVQAGGSDVLMALYQNKVQVGSGSTTKTTLAEFWGMKWGGVTGSGNDTYHDHHVVWTGLGSEAKNMTWIQAARGNETVDSTGWAKSSATDDFYEVLRNAGTGSATTVTFPSELSLGVQDRSDVSIAWDPKIMGVQLIGIAIGDSGTPDVSVQLDLGTQSTAGTTISPTSYRDITSFNKLMPDGNEWTASAVDNIQIVFKAG